MLISTIPRCGRSKEFNCSTSSPNMESHVSKKNYYSLKFSDPLQKVINLLLLHFYYCICYKKKKKQKKNHLLSWMHSNTMGVLKVPFMNIQIRLWPFKVEEGDATARDVLSQKEQKRFFRNVTPLDYFWLILFEAFLFVLFSISDKDVRHIRIRGKKSDCLHYFYLFFLHSVFSLSLWCWRLGSSCEIPSQGFHEALQPSSLTIAPHLPWI